MEVFSSQIQLEKLLPRTHELIEMLNNMPISGTALMVVLDTFLIGETSKISGKIQLTFNEVKVIFNVVASSMTHISYFASQFNMCSAHYCDIRFEIVEPATLKVDFTPPKNCEETIKNFFNLTSSYNDSIK